MKSRTLAGAAGLAGLAALAGWTIARNGADPGQRAPAERPPLALLTSLPLLFGEEFGLEGGGSAALERLDQRYRVQPVAVADSASLQRHRLLLMAHPRAQPADTLVELDQWVRRGGRVLLLADPRLDWPSERPLGDVLRPPPAFADTGLLAHWGMRLDGPAALGPVKVGNGRIQARSSSPGKLASERCRLAGDGFIARCSIGRGRVTVVADADFLNVESDDTENLELLFDELARLEPR